MNNNIISNHWMDNDGNPAGGCTCGRGFAVSWQNGPLGRGRDRRDPNGAFVEDIIHAARDRLEFYQQDKFACAENEEAIRALTDALASLNKRTKNREEREVEGTHAR